MENLLIFILLVSLAACQADPRVYTFGISPIYAPYLAPSSTPSQTGLLQDVIKKVCEKANKKCELVSFNDYNYCWDTEKMSSEGLNNRYWDVCVSWYHTPERALVYSFFGDHAEEEPSYLYARTGTNFKNYDPETHVTGFRKSYWTSSHCLRKEYGTEVKNQRLYSSMKTMIDDIKSGQIDVGFINYSDMGDMTGLRRVSDRIKCTNSGLAMMVRKEDLPDFMWFDETMKEVAKSPFYKWICNIAKLAYGGEPWCLK